MDSHAAWFARRLARPDPFYIVEDQGQPCGFVRLDQTDAAAPWEVSILIAQAAQGRGLAHAALGLLRLTHPKRHTTAHVHPANTASQRLFSGAGYQRQAGDQFLSLGWAQKAAGDCDAN
ncbi:MAG: GNAT family N-acetyltransferase [Pseudomonadota bacterium]